MTGTDGTAAADAPGRVTGTVVYRERMALRPGAVVEVWLLDTSRADAPAIEIAHQVIEDPGTPPIPFVLEYDPSQIDERMEYGLRAAITWGDRLLFTTDTHYPVLTRGAGNTADLLLVMVEQSASTPAAPLTGTFWKLTSIGTERYRHQGEEREPHIRFTGEDATVSGRTGCNAFSGGYEIAGSSLKLGNLAVTQRACIEGMDIERIYLDALGATDRFEISGDTLTLFAADRALLGFERGGPE